ncbi:MAG: LPP20 family lipoprotein [Paludibacteraceae bacterium]|nr:LPP20 family lipoprotein [Paludibacteraceae bacterium]
MKRFISISIMVLLPILMLAEVPQWVTEHPNMPTYWWGIGTSNTSVSDYKEKAAKLAINEIATQISVKVESNSFLNIKEKNYNYSEDFKKQINLNTDAYLEGLQLYDSYQDKNQYYVCYRLDKDQYYEFLKRKSNEIAKQGYEYLVVANNALEAGNLHKAALTYIKGLETVEPWLFLDLKYNQTNIPLALFSSYTSLSEGLNITLQPTHDTLEANKSINLPFTAILTRNNTNIPNFSLLADFLIGSGSVTQTATTDLSGTATFNITQINSQSEIAQIKITIDPKEFGKLPDRYSKYLNTQNLPQAVFTAHVKTNNTKIYISVDHNDIPQCILQISNLLSNQQLPVTEDLYSATHVLHLLTFLKYNGTVGGGLEDLDEYIAALQLKMTDASGNVLWNYTIDSARVLTQTSASKTDVTSQATRELMKRVRRELPSKIKF